MTLQNDRYGRTVAQQDDKNQILYTVTDPLNRGGGLLFTIGFPMDTTDERILGSIEAMAPDWYTPPTLATKETKDQLLQKLAELTAKVNSL